MRLHRKMSKHHRNIQQQLNDDMRLLQRMVTGSSVYRKRQDSYIRKPKYPKSLYSQ